MLYLNLLSDNFDFYLQLDHFHSQDRPIVKHPAKFLPIVTVIGYIHLRNGNKKQIEHLIRIRFWFWNKKVCD